MTGLALQGGGCLGYGQVLTLIKAEELWNKPSYQIFDAIAGTSVGSIIGACLAVGIPAQQIESFFTQDAPKIFDASWLDEAEMLFEPKYNSKTLENSLQATLGNKTLADCKTRFTATAYDWPTDRPVYFKSFEASSEDNDHIVIGMDSNIALWQVCRASSAAQTYFPAFKYNSLVLLDGGNTGDNAPDLLLTADMLALADLEQIKMLSLGSGITRWNVTADSMVNPGVMRAGLSTIKIVFSAGEDAQVYKVKQMLKDNHIRLSPDLGNGIDIDDADGCLTKIPPEIKAMLTADNLAKIGSFSR